MEFKTKICKYWKCNKKFVPTREWQKYCSSACRKNAWNERHNISELKQLSKRIENLEEKLEEK